MSNVEIFKKFMKENNFYLDEQHDDQGTFFRFRERLEGGGEVTIVVSFSKSEEIIELFFLDIATISDPLKKESLHNFLNEINSNYRFAKIFEYEGDIRVEYSYREKQNNLDPTILFDFIVLTIRQINEFYPKLMKIQWA